MDATLDGSFGDVEQAGDLEPGQVPRMAQGQDQPVARVEPVKRPVKLANREGLIEGPGRGGLLEIELGESVLTLRGPERRPDHLSAEPRRKRSRITQRIKAEPSREQRVLDCVGTGISRACDEPSGSKGSGEMRGDEVPKRIAIAGPGSRNEGCRAGGRTRRHGVHT